MDEGWNIRYYQAPQQSTPPVYDFINNLDANAKYKVINTINLLESYGIRLGPPHAKKLTGTDLWELRILGQDNIRILYIAISGKNFLLLHGFNKKKQKTDKREVDIALVRLKEYKSR
ncbi:MAG: type II toxin-antitoxin system RelE/ParE family toxin [Microgenomates group bacterium]|jgi:phage-related protein